MNKEQYKALIEKQLNEFMEGMGPVEIAEIKSSDATEPTVEAWHDAFTCWLYDNTI